MLGARHHVRAYARDGTAPWTPPASRGIALTHVADKRDALITAADQRTVAKRFLGFEPELFGRLHDQPAPQCSIQNQMLFMVALDSEQRPVLDIAGRAASAAAPALDGRRDAEVRTARMRTRGPAHRGDS